MLWFDWSNLSPDKNTEKHPGNHAGQNTGQTSKLNASETTEATKTTTEKPPRKPYVVRSSLLGLFVLLNSLAYIGAYSFTNLVRPRSIDIGIPRPEISKTPKFLGLTYSTQRISINKKEWLELWSIPAATGSKPFSAMPLAAKGTIVLFPGSGGNKAQHLLAPAQEFHRLGYDVVLVDFRGVGGSSGHTSTIGVREAQDVTIVVNYLERSLQQSAPHRPLILYGLSMGGAAILRAVAYQGIKPDGIILELPFARLLNATRSRVRKLGLPAFPIAESLVFWGGFQHGFNGFIHNPEDYAKTVHCPTLVLHGQRDPWTTTSDIQKIVQNLQGPKQLVIFPKARHELLVKVDRPTWTQTIDQFLQNLPFSSASR